MTRMEFAACVVLSLSWAATADAAETLTGYAYARDDGRFLYTENHVLVEPEGGRPASHRVDYRGPQGKVFATKDLDYTRHAYAPDFRTTDLRDGYVEGAEHGSRGYRLFRRADRDGEFESDWIEVSDDLVSDSGFDRYIKAHLDDLAGAPREFRMAVAGSLIDLAFEARLESRQVLFGREAVTLRVEPASILSWFSDPILVTYDTGSRRLLRYVGLSNIRDTEGNRHDARIDFPPDGFEPDAAPRP